MLVRLVGFTFKVLGKGGLSFSNFARALAEVKPEVVAESQERRLLFINDQHYADYYVGLVVTVKNHRTFCELVTAGGNLLVKVNELDHDSSLMDFNFFVLNKLTGAGLYQHYHQSCSVTAFGAIAARRFSEYREVELKNAIASAGGDSASKAVQLKIRQRHINHLHTEIIVRQEALSALIEEMKRVKAFEYCLSTPLVEEDAFAPLKPFVKRKSERIIFSMGTPVQTVANALNAFVGATSLANGRVEGVDEDGIVRILNIVDNPDTFGEYDYDDLAPKLNELDLTQFHQSWVITELIEKCKGNKAIFEYMENP